VEPLPLSVRTVEDVAAAHLGGATEAAVAAFRMACLQTVLHLECPERTAIVLTYGDGDDWRERVADLVPLQWGLCHGTIARQPGTGPVARPPGGRRVGSSRGGARSQRSRSSA
jgi:hypothetical protein